MKILLLDTTVIIDAINGKRGRGQFLENLVLNRNLLACCSINVTEVYAGIRSHEVRRTESFMRSLRFYEVTWDIARFAGELKNRWARKGHTIALPDITISAVALANSLTLITDNRKHFPMPELQFLELPAEPEQ
jgi:predicted nucleic acid-binding protein